MSWASKAAKKVRHAVKKAVGSNIYQGLKGAAHLAIGNPQGFGEMAQGVVGTAQKAYEDVSGITAQNRAMQNMLAQQEAYNNQQLALAEAQAKNQAGSMVEFSETATNNSVLQKLLAKRSALSQTIRTAGQQRFGD